MTREIEKILVFPKGHCKIVLNTLAHDFVMITASFMLKLKREFCNNKLEMIEKDPGDWISNLEGLQL